MTQATPIDTGNQAVKTPVPIDTIRSTHRQVVQQTRKRGPTDRERELILRLLNGDEAAFATLVEKYSGSMVRLAMSFVSSRAVAEEVVQETWLAVLKGLPRFQGKSSLKTWMFRILTNRAKTRGVREGRTIPFTSLGDDDSGGLDPDRFTHTGDWRTPPLQWDDDTPERSTLTAEAVSRVFELLDTLPDKQRTVVTMRDIQGYTSSDVCKVLEISETYQRVLLHRGRNKIRDALGEYMQAA